MESWCGRVMSLVSGLFVVSAVLAVMFVKLAREVQEQETKVFDEYILRSIHTIAGPLLDQVVIHTTNIGGWMVAVWGVLLAMVVSYKRAWDKLVIVCAGLIGAELLNLLLKGLFARPRPTLWERLIVEQSFSFPSGHAMASSALAFVIIAVAWQTRWRWWATVGAVSFMVYIGLTRLYLGVHFPTDILAGWCVSGAWVGLVTWAVGRANRRLNRPSRLSTTNRQRDEGF